jgi:hypothetical protein
MHTRLVSLALTGVLAGAACDVRVGEHGVSVDIAQGKATDEWSRTYTVAPGGRLEVLNVNGSIEVSRATGPVVTVKAVREARADSDEAAQAMLRAMPAVSEQVSPERVRVEVASTDGSSRRRTSVQFFVNIPPGLTASFKTVNGRVLLDNVDGQFEALTTSGGVTGRDVSGSVTASSENGGVRMGLATIRGDVTLRTTNGGVRVEVPPATDADLEISTVNGGVAVDDGLALTVSDRTRTHVAGRLNRGGRRIEARTINGGVRVMPREAP